MVMEVGKSADAEYYEDYHEFYDPLTVARTMGVLSMLQRDTVQEAAELMRLTAGDLLARGVADAVIPEPEGGMDGGPGDVQVYQALGEALDRELERFSKMSGAALARHRYQKYRRMGTREKRRGSR